MYRRILISLFLMLFVGTTMYAQSMSDEQVLNYVKEGVTAGKSQKQLITELSVRGVTQVQAERVKKLYESQQAGIKQKTLSNMDVQRGNPESLDEKKTDMEGIREIEEDSIKVFGRNIFRNKNLTFEPSQNLATPQYYRLGPNDEVIIDIWGASENTIRAKISPDGYINIPDVGPVFLNGMTIQAANAHLKKELSKIYSGITNASVSSATDVKLSLGQIRTIQVNIMGEVVNPGTYALSSFSTVFHALYKAGGVSNLGSLRNIKLVRGGRTVATVDVYDYIMQGRSQDDIRLQEGDVVLVAPYEQLVSVDGNVKRPMYYEMKKGETVKTLIYYAGGFTNDAYTRSLTIERKNGREMTICTVDDMDYPVFQLHDGDAISVGALLKRYDNRVQIKGAVYREGFYELNGRVNTVRELVEKADGLMDDAFLNRAVLHRERPDRSLEVIAVDIKGIMDGTSPNVPLQKNDVLYIPSVNDLSDRGILTISGEVFSPGEFPYAANTTLEDLVIQAGGLKESASTVRVDISRRIKDSKSEYAGKEIAKMFSFSLKDGFVIEGEPGFKLQPYDHVFVRRSPAYSDQKNAKISGEVQFGGEFTLTERGERLTDLLKKAGGVTQFAYVKGARLSRRINDDERRRMESVLNMAEKSTSGRDSIDVKKLNLGEIYYVGINLDKALANPGSAYDVILREGDEVVIPQYNSTVSISGAVMYPNTTTYKPGANLRYYISEGGGYGNRAKKRAAYIIYMNGHVKKVGRSASREIEPGCEIIVPEKGKSNWNLASTLSVATTTASLATMAATIANIIRTK